MNGRLMGGESRHELTFALLIPAGRRVTHPLTYSGNMRMVIKNVFPRSRDESSGKVPGGRLPVEFEGRTSFGAQSPPGRTGVLLDEVGFFHNL